MTVSVTFTLWLRPPLVHVIVSVYIPGGLVIAGLTVSVEEPEPVTKGLLKEAVASEGNPDTLKLTVPEKPFTEETVTEKLVLVVCTTICEEGVAEMLKSGAGFTVTFREGGLGSVRPALSVTVSVAAKVPGEL